METVLLARWLVPGFRTGGRLGLFLAATVSLWAQAGPPVSLRLPGPGAANHLADIRRRLVSARPIDLTARRAIEYGREFVSSAEKALHAGQPFIADRLADAVDALLHVAERQQHLRAEGGPKGPPSAQEAQDHLQRVYFRTQQANYFFQQCHDPRAASFPKWARDFYQLAVRAYERKDMAAADENAKCAEEVVRALENLAQAAAPATIPAPPKPPVP